MNQTSPRPLHYDVCFSSKVIKSLWATLSARSVEKKLLRQPKDDENKPHIANG